MRGRITTEVTVFNDSSPPPAAELFSQGSLNRTRLSFRPERKRSGEIPRNRNENNRTRLQKNTRSRRICVPTVETVRHIHASARSPVAARHREIPCNRNENHRIRLTQILASAIPTVTPFPRNDKLHGRERRFIRIDVIKPNVHPYRLVIARSAKRDVAISRKGRRTWRTRTLYLFRGGFLRCVRTVALTPVEMTL